MHRNQYMKYFCCYYHQDFLSAGFITNQSTNWIPNGLPIVGFYVIMFLLNFCRSRSDKYEYAKIFLTHSAVIGKCLRPVICTYQVIFIV